MRGTLGRLIILTGSIHPAPSLYPPTSGQSQLKRQLSVSGLSICQGPPYLAQPSSMKEPGVQHTAAPQSPQSTHRVGAGSCRLTRAEATTIWSWRWGWESLAIALNLGPGKWVALASSSGPLPLACPQVPWLAPQPKARGPGGPWAKPAIYLELNSSERLTLVELDFELH